MFAALGAGVPYALKQNDAIRETVGRLVINDYGLSADLFVMGFETDGTPIVEYNNVKYHKEINWEETRYGESDKFCDGDVMPYVWDDFGKLPNMGLVPPECDDILDELLDED